MRLTVTGLEETEADLAAAITETRDRLATSLLQELRAATPVETGRARDGWHLTEADLRNEVPYVGRLNAGSSRQAPAGFVEAAIDRALED
ncbi:hypothetical protein [Oceanibaculum indicum]|uniref:Uncharacterized protein n=1 Tax=Oceanibaculum indicum TaxID=526216 RepID=A0A420WGZ8_9PROT|nr:hypothetical protein [Oceanibaculum indicum]RKQ70205.1 hypothetical protein BCL74_2146 [Oceanibaculum indicum]